MGRVCNCRAVAYHEAGHAVVGILLGRSVVYATMRPEAARWDKDGTRWQLRAHVKYSDNAAPDVRALSSMAGPYSESYYTGKWDKWIGAESDLEHLGAEILEIAGMLTPNNLPIAQMYTYTSEWHEHLATIHERTQALLREHWPAVMDVAESLLNSEELSGTAIEQIVRDQDRSLPPAPRARWGMCEECRREYTRQCRSRKHDDPTVRQLTFFDEPRGPRREERHLEGGVEE